MRFATRLFLNSQDISLIQIKHILAPNAADWRDCKLDIKKCTPAQLNQIRCEYFYLIDCHLLTTKLIFLSNLTLPLLDFQSLEQNS
jgi:hypothetical protein